MQQVWQTRWKSMGWVALGAVALVLLVAAVYKKNHKTCTAIEVLFDGDGNNYFIDEKGVVALLKANGVEPGMELANINLRVLEDKLKSDEWIANADLYFDNKQVLKALIKEKEPVARMFTPDGSSFYIDSSCRRLPLSQRLSARIPMFTGFPSDKAVLSKPDSTLLASAKDLAIFIQSDDFWKAQVAQIDITPEGFDMIPTIGSHVVRLGKDGNYQSKFDRLFSFYKQVWTKVGFEAYEKLDVRYDGQVVATVKGTQATAVVDSAKAQAALAAAQAGDLPDSDEVSTVAPPPHMAIVRDTTKATHSVIAKPSKNPVPKPLAIMGKPPVKPVQSKNANAKVANRRPVRQSLSDEEEKIKNEAIKQLHGGKKVLVKPVHAASSSTTQHTDGNNKTHKGKAHN